MRGLSSLEVLIVVAALALLTVIAVPNYLEAEVRRNVSRVKTDLRCLATAIESYRADTGKVPREQNSNFYGPGDLLPDREGNLVQVAGLMSNVLSTPVPYLSVARLPEVFLHESAPIDEQYYSYHDTMTRAALAAASFYQVAPVFYGPWRLLSIGPDRSYSHSFSNSVQLAYDPTNGTYSPGNIHRAALFSDSLQPHAGQVYVNGSSSAVLLGAH